MRVFADTSGFFAALVRNDSEHHRACPVLAQLLPEGTEIHTTNYVALETFALLQPRVNRGAALAFEQTLRPLLRVRWIDEGLHARAVRLLESEPGASVSLVDAASFAAMAEEDLNSCFGCDHHFAHRGFRMLSSPEDLGN